MLSFFKPKPMETTKPTWRISTNGYGVHFVQRLKVCCVGGHMFDGYSSILGINHRGYSSLEAAEKAVAEWEERERMSKRKIVKEF